MPDVALSSCVELSRGPTSHRNTPSLMSGSQKISQSHCGPYLSIVTNSWAPTDRQKSWSQEGSLLQAPPPALGAYPGAHIFPEESRVPCVCLSRWMQGADRCLCVPVKYVCLFHMWDDVWPQAYTLPCILTMSQLENLSFNQRPSPCMC